MTSHDFSDLEEGTTDIAPKYAPRPRGTFALQVIEGRDAGKTYVLDPDQPSRTLVGQSPACAFQLSDPQVSRRHFALEIAGDRLHVTDLGSTNGTFVGTMAIVDVFLVGGEILRLGSTSIRVEHRTAAPVARPAVRQRFGKVLGTSPAMVRLYPLIERLAASDVPLVIEGETGTGKEALAEAIHEAGARANGPFVVFDCTAIAANLAESELFGHAKRAGAFQQANGGTLLIDEIGDLELAVQAKLLRAIERPDKVSVRVIATTRRDLDQEVQRGRFRDDLFYRLAVGRIELPALRDRAGDVTMLARHFWSELGGDAASLPGDVLARWESSAWPGNVRQLRNAVARQLALGELADEPAERPAVSDADFIGRVIGEGHALPVARLQVVREFERRYIEAVLARHGGNVVHAAKASGIARRYFQILKGGTRR